MLGRDASGGLAKPAAAQRALQGVPASFGRESFADSGAVGFTPELVTELDAAERKRREKLSREFS